MTRLIGRAELMKYLDGELAPARARSVQQRLAWDQDAAAELAKLERLGALLRAWGSERAIGVADDLHVAVMHGIQQAVPSAPELRLVRGGGGSAASSPGVGRGQGLRRSGRRTLAVLAAGAAAAACLLLVLGGSPTGSPGVGEAVSSGRPDSEPAAQGIDPASDADPGAAIESVDFGDQRGAIFMVPAGSTATPVVWLTDEPEPARVESL